MKNHPKDSIDNVLDRLSDMREEILSIERSIERISASQQRDGSRRSESSGPEYKAPDACCIKTQVEGRRHR
jgi:predicted translin family RNA/ssDNA-binding protein